MPTVAYVGRDVPREVIMAAGLRPVRLAGRPGRTATGERFCGPGVDRHTCALLTRILDGDLRGCRGLAIGADSEGTLRLYRYLREIQRLEPFPGVPPSTLVDFGHLPRPSTARYNRSRFDEFVADVEGWAGRPVTDDGLAAAARATATTRRLIRAIGQARATPAGPLLSGSRAWRAIAASFRLPAERFHATATELLTQVEQARPVAGVRVFLTGSAHDHPGAYRAIEARGAVVVGEDHDWGALAGEESTVDAAEEIRDALVRAYWQPPPVAAGYGSAQRARVTAELAVRSRAQLAVAWLRVDDPAPAWDLPAQRAALAEYGIPLLELPPQPYSADPDPAALALLDTALSRVDTTVTVR